MIYCYHNGLISDVTSLHVNGTDLGLQRGYGIFDFLRVDGNKPLYMDDHLDRFFNSANFMHLKPSEDRTKIMEIITQLIERNALDYSGIRMILTGGPSPDGYTITSPTLIILQQPMHSPPQVLPELGIRLFSYQYQRQLPNVKTTDYLMAIHLQPWLKQKNGDDILYHQEGVITECPRSNIFMITKEGVLVTPKIGMLKGVTRMKILQLANELNIPTEERTVTLCELKDATAVFITSSTKRMLPVTSIDDMLIQKEEHATLLLIQLWKGLLQMEN